MQEGKKWASLGDNIAKNGKNNDTNPYFLY